MKKSGIFALIVWFGLVGSVSAELYGRPADEYVENLVSGAAHLREQGNRDAARELYRRAAEMGHAHAHYMLGYAYSRLRPDKLFHFTEAAKQGHPRALGKALEVLLFRAVGRVNNLRYADPHQALSLYHEAKRLNPDVSDVVSAAMLRVMEMCVEPPAFDVDGFMTAYEIPETPTNASPYFIWELAEEASRGGRFGEPDPELTLQLVMRGGSVPVELRYAVEWAYQNWKDDKGEVFKIENFVVSGQGYLHIMRESWHRQVVGLYDGITNIDGLSDQEVAPHITNAWHAVISYLDAKTRNEESHGGFGQWRTLAEGASLIRQLQEFADLIALVDKGEMPAPKNALDEATRKMTDTLHGLDEAVKPESVFHNISYSDIEQVQALWVTHRDTAAKIMTLIDPELSPDDCAALITEHRTKNLKKTLLVIAGQHPFPGFLQVGPP